VCGRLNVRRVADRPADLTLCRSYRLNVQRVAPKRATFKSCRYGRPSRRRGGWHLEEDHFDDVLDLDAVQAHVGVDEQAKREGRQRAGETLASG
jgi:hypothetical protein